MLGRLKNTTPPPPSWHWSCRKTPGTFVFTARLEIPAVASEMDGKSQGNDKQVTLGPPGGHDWLLTPFPSPLQNNLNYEIKLKMLFEADC